MLCVVGGASDNGVGARSISFPSSSKCCSKLSAQQLGLSSIGGRSGLPCDLLQCACSCLCGLISIPAAMFAASFDRSCALWTIASFAVVMMSVGHLNPSPAIFCECIVVLLGLISCCLRAFSRVFKIGFSNIFLKSSSDYVRWGP